MWLDVWIIINDVPEIFLSFTGITFIIILKCQTLNSAHALQKTCLQYKCWIPQKCNIHHKASVVDTGFTIGGCANLMREGHWLPTWLRKMCVSKLLGPLGEVLGAPTLIRQWTYLYKVGVFSIPDCDYSVNLFYQLLFLIIVKMHVPLG